MLRLLVRLFRARPVYRLVIGGLLSVFAGFMTMNDWQSGKGLSGGLLVIVLFVSVALSGVVGMIKSK